MKPVAFLKIAGSVACVAFALNASAQASDTTTTSSSPSTTAHAAKAKLSNGAITTKVKAKLLATSGLKSTGIHVHTVGDEVTLSGHVPTSDQKSLAKDTTASVDGVATVRNHLKVVAE